MRLIQKIYDLIPHRIRKIFKNDLTLLLHRYFVLRPIYLKSIITGINIELTDRCNLRCSYCPKSKGIGVDAGDMDFELFKEIFNQALTLLPLKNVCLEGFGEPLLYPYLAEAIEYIKSKNSKISILITTNGILLNSDWAEKFTKLGLDQITISVNATSKAQYQQINNAYLYDRVVSNAITFLDYVNSSNSSIRVLIQVLEGPNGSKEIASFRQFWTSKLGKCGEIQVQPFVNWAGIIRTNMHNVAKCDYDNRYPCAHLQTSCIITREGNALACCMVIPGDEGDLKLGNIKEKTLKELYMAGKILELRKLNAEGKVYKLSPCRTCDAYKTVSNVWIKNPFHPHIGRKWI